MSCTIYIYKVSGYFFNMGKKPTSRKNFLYILSINCQLYFRTMDSGFLRMFTEVQGKGNSTPPELAYFVNEVYGQLQLCTNPIWEG